ncbi:DUF892 family protein [Flammeovirga yaeyamensis]|uniref:DUF892 family protein n=1 Tax=Flammeovirga yaeyamensis TaxID=367791 RepID=A0AAX1N0S0_9BACT|nr:MULTISPECIES: DUF892 family protein [Flammeovirga]ANQ47503.1 DUF892 family protein [Flammeovirga sp. MY04]MBB3698542.1 ferritin-like metal-binding protein YciE [Flammeovirga yaeyamensis]NMF34109.1 DUF892 family protein [Flammeovirga yaeyamensis]QWG01096.1 DUF892 family protein [Flammeovirga yaeyamensis]
MKPLDDLRDLFIHQMKDRYDAETQQLEIYHQLKGRVKSIALSRVIEICEHNAEKHLNSLNELFFEIHENEIGDICECSLGMIKEMHKMIEHSTNSNVSDMAIVSTIKQLHAADVIGYQLILSYAHQVHDETIMDRLYEILKNEQDLDVLLDETISRLIEKEQELVKVYV